MYPNTTPRNTQATASSPLGVVLVSLSEVGLDPLKREWTRVLEAFKRMRFLSNNWDLEGAISPSAATVRRAIEIANSLSDSRVPPPTMTSPTPLGSILLAWRDESSYQEIEVVSEDQVEWMIRDSDGEYTHGEFLAKPRRSTRPSLDETFNRLRDLEPTTNTFATLR